MLFLDMNDIYVPVLFVDMNDFNDLYVCWTCCFINYLCLIGFA